MTGLLEWTTVGGFLCGAAAGGAARFGRLCSMSAVEDALVGRDWRAAKAWGLALATAIVANQIAIAAELTDASRSVYAALQWHALGTVLGGLVFGLGMALTGTCSFGLLVRTGGGDLRCAVSAGMVGIAAFAVTAGAVAPLRDRLLAVGVVPLGDLGGTTFTAITAHWLGAGFATLVWLVVAAGLTAMAAFDARLRRRPRLMAAAVALGLAAAAGWLVTSQAVERLELDRPESLSFVAPVGRALLQVMTMPFRNAGFGVAAVAGVVAASLAVSIWRRELRWEAFDDPTEMRRHLGGAALMGIGGVLAQGCTIGQGLSAGGLLAVSTPVFIIAVLAGARIGLSYLIEGQAVWRMGKSSKRPS